MGSGQNTADEALSALDWWRLAGVDMVIDEAPRNWLARILPTPPAVAPPPPVPDRADDIPAIHAALAALAISGAGEERLMPEGDVAAGVMLLADMPDPEDGIEGRLFGGASGRLLDRMLAAIGRDRASIYLATILPARPAGGRLDQATAAAAVALARRHVALAAPRALLLCGEGATRAMLGQPLLTARGRRHILDHDGTNVAAITTFHPCHLLEHPLQKAGAWDDLRLLLGELAG